jgi:hypothetical protein
VFGYQPTGSSRTLFPFGITVSVVTSLGLRLLLTGAQPAASRAAEARRAVARVHREIAFINQDRDTRLEHQQRADGTTGHRRHATGHDTPAL